MAAEEAAVEALTEGMAQIRVSFAALGAAFTAAAASITTYYLLDQKLRKKYEQVAEDEISQMREHFQAKEIAREEKPKLEEIIQEQGYVKAPIPQKEQVSGTSLTKARDIAAQNPQTEEEAEYAKAESEMPGQTRVNVFEQHSEAEEWNYETEVKSRSPERPYVIHQDELGEHRELDQLHWTYYEGDEILVNQSDEVVTDVERCVGLSNLDRFGHGTDDPDAVHIRNVVLGIEVEIIRSHGKYEEEVLGLQHADESIRRRKRRFDDDAG